MISTCDPVLNREMRRPQLKGLRKALIFLTLNEHTPAFSWTF